MQTTTGTERQKQELFSQEKLHVTLPMVLQKVELEEKVSTPFFWTFGSLAALMGKHGFAEKLQV